MFNTFKTSPADLGLLRELGLQAYSGSTGQEFFLGEVAVDNDGSCVRIWVTGYPAQFWRFWIYCADTQKVSRVETGSGILRDYWPMAKAIAQGMLVVRGETND
jgi:hypothetical protein